MAIVSVGPVSVASKRSWCANGNAAISASWAAKSKRAASTAPSATASWRSTCQPLAAVSSPCIGEPVGVPAQRRGLGVDGDLAAGDREAHAGDPVRPRIEQRDAHRGPLGDVGRAAPAAARAAPRRGGAASIPPSPRRGRTSPRCRRPPATRGSGRGSRRRPVRRSCGPMHRGSPPQRRRRQSPAVTGGGLPEPGALQRWRERRAPHGVPPTTSTTCRPVASATPSSRATGAAVRP